MADLKTAHLCINTIQELRVQYGVITGSISLHDMKMMKTEGDERILMQHEHNNLQDDLGFVARQIAIYTDLLFGMDDIEIVVQSRSEV